MTTAKLADAVDRTTSWIRSLYVELFELRKQVRDLELMNSELRQALLFARPAQSYADEQQESYKKMMFQRDEAIRRCVVLRNKISALYIERGLAPVVLDPTPPSASVRAMAKKAAVAARARLAAKARLVEKRYSK